MYPIPTDKIMGNSQYLTRSLQKFILLISIFLMPFAQNLIHAKQHETLEQKLAGNYDSISLQEKKGQQKISINIEHLTLTETLTRLAKKLNVGISYQSGIIPDKTIHIQMENVSIHKILDTIFQGTNLKAVLPPSKDIIIIKQKKRQIEKVIDEEVSGVVTAAGSEETLPGVNVVLKGTTQGVTTNLDGEYSITVPSLQDTLVYSFIGYKTQTIPINGRATINVEMEEKVIAGEEMVVIGYGEREKQDVTGAVSSIGSEEIGQSINVSPELSIQGRVPGVNVTNTSGTPGARPEIRVRGIGTFGVADPLFVVDGVPITEFGAGAEGQDPRNNDLRGPINIFSLINPDDIESISVLKDASAAAVYGVRAANGVVLITTKSGQAGDTRVRLDISGGVQNLPNTHDVLNTQQYTQLYQEAFANNPDQAGNLPSVFDPNSNDFLGNSETFDWQNELKNQSANVQNYNLSVSGGNPKTTYFFSGGYSKTEAPVDQNLLERYSVSGRFNSDISDLIDVGATFRFGYVNTLNNTQANVDDIALAPPWQPIFNQNGPFGLGFQQVFDANGDLAFGPETNANVFAAQDLNRQDFQILRNIGSAFIEISPVESVQIKATINGDFSRNERNNFEDVRGALFDPSSSTVDIDEEESVGSFDQRNLRNHNLSGEFSINYVEDFGKHSVNILGNAMLQRFGFDGLSGSTEFLESRDPDRRFIQEIADREQINVFSDKQRDALRGFLIRSNYNYDNKYIVDVTVRHDGSSRFAENFRWGTFPSFSAAWRLSNEPFMEKYEFINDLKIRGGWGRLGNQETRRFAFLSTVGNEPTLGLGSGNGDATGNVEAGARLPDFPTRDLTWEKVTSSSIGFESTMLQNSVNFSFEYYRRDTDGILQQVQIAPSVGNENAPVFNVAQVRNTGVEIVAGYTKFFNDFQFRINGNISTVNNEVIQLADGQPFGGTGGRIEEGRPIGFLWGLEVDGIFQSQAEIDEWSQTTSEPGSVKSPGDIRFKDSNGDGVINEDDRTFLGSPIPDFNYGFSLSGSYKRFDANLFFQGVGGAERVNFARIAGEGMNSQGLNQWTTVLNRWTPDNPSTTMPRAVRGDPGSNNRFSDRWVEDASFLRLKNFQVGYTLPSDFLSGLGANGTNYRIYVSGRNLVTITDWTGLDPEVNQNAVPLPRTFIFGIQADL